MIFPEFLMYWVGTSVGRQKKMTPLPLEAVQVVQINEPFKANRADPSDLQRLGAADVHEGIAEIPLEVRELARLSAATEDCTGLFFGCIEAKFCK